MCQYNDLSFHTNDRVVQNEQPSHPHKMVQRIKRSHLDKDDWLKCTSTQMYSFFFLRSRDLYVSGKVAAAQRLNILGAVQSKGPDIPQTCGRPSASMWHGKGKAPSQTPADAPASADCQLLADIHRSGNAQQRSPPQFPMEKQRVGVGKLGNAIDACGP